jgi:hypothetical protein
LTQARRPLINASRWRPSAAAPSHPDIEPVLGPGQFRSELGAVGQREILQLVAHDPPNFRALVGVANLIKALLIGLRPELADSPPAQQLPLTQPHA